MQKNSGSAAKQHTKSSSCSEIDIKSLDISSGNNSNKKKKEGDIHVGNKSTESVSSLRSEHSNSNPQQGNKMAVKSYAEMARGEIVEPPVQQSQQAQQPQLQVQVQAVVADAKGAPAGHHDKAPDAAASPPPAVRENGSIAPAPAPISAPAAFSAGAMPLHPHFFAHQQNHTPFSAEAWEQRKKTKVPPNKKDTRKLFVGGLPTDVTEEEFELFWRQFGEITDSVVMVDKESGRSRGFGFVTFKEEGTARAILQSYPDPNKYGSACVLMRDKPCEVKPAVPKDGNNFYGQNHRSHRNNNPIKLPTPAPAFLSPPPMGVPVIGSPHSAPHSPVAQVPALDGGFMPSYPAQVAAAYPAQGYAAYPPPQAQDYNYAPGYGPQLAYGVPMAEPIVVSPGYGSTPEYAYDYSPYHQGAAVPQAMPPPPLYGVPSIPTFQHDGTTGPP